MLHSRQTKQNSEGRGTYNITVESLRMQYGSFLLFLLLNAHLPEKASHFSPEYQLSSWSLFHLSILNITQTLKSGDFQSVSQCKKCLISMRRRKLKTIIFMIFVNFIWVNDIGSPSSFSVDVRASVSSDSIFYNFVHTINSCADVLLCGSH